jgi:hypothetical protein
MKIESRIVRNPRNPPWSPFFKGGNSMFNDHCPLVIDKWFALLPLKKGGWEGFLGKPFLGGDDHGKSEKAVGRNL